MLDKAIYEKDPVKRLAYISVYALAQFNHMERGTAKPFNPMQGETFELVKEGRYKMLSELCIHHPPVLGYYIDGDSGFKRYTTIRFKPRFNKGSIEAKNICKDYIELLPHNERYDIRSPGI